MERMDVLKDSVISSFAENDLARVDKYIDSLRESLKSTNAQFGRFTFLTILSVFSYHLYIEDKLREISAFGIILHDHDLLVKWFLVVISSLFMLTASIGYLRVYQGEAIEWLLAKYRPSEFKSGIYRLTFPASYILGLDVLRRQNSCSAKAVAAFPGIALTLFSVLMPILYVYWAYRRAFNTYGLDLQLIISSFISALLIVHGILIIRESQKI